MLQMKKDFRWEKDMMEMIAVENTSNNGEAAQPSFSGASNFAYFTDYKIPQGHGDGPGIPYRVSG